MKEQIFGISLSAETDDRFNLVNVTADKRPKFAILKIGGRDYISREFYKDKKFEGFYRLCKENGICVGAYFVGNANSIEIADKEATYLRSLLQEYEFEYPIFYYLEGEILGINKRRLTTITNRVTGIIRSAGYLPGVYASMETLAAHVFNLELNSGIVRWVKSWTLHEPTFTDTNLTVDMWEFGGDTNRIRSNTIGGALVYQTYSSVDYMKFTREMRFNGFGSPIHYLTKEDLKILEPKFWPEYTIKMDGTTELLEKPIEKTVVVTVPTPTPAPTPAPVVKEKVSADDIIQRAKNVASSIYGTQLATKEEELVEANPGVQTMLEYIKSKGLDPREFAEIMGSAMKANKVEQQEEEPATITVEEKPVLTEALKVETKPTPHGVEYVPVKEEPATITVGEKPDLTEVIKVEAKPIPLVVAHEPVKEEPVKEEEKKVEEPKKEVDIELVIQILKMQGKEITMGNIMETQALLSGEIKETASKEVLEIKGEEPEPVVEKEPAPEPEPIPEPEPEPEVDLFIIASGYNGTDYENMQTTSFNNLHDAISECRRVSNERKKTFYVYDDKTKEQVYGNVVPEPKPEPKVNPIPDIPEFGTKNDSVLPEDIPDNTANWGKAFKGSDLTNLTKEDLYMKVNNDQVTATFMEGEIDRSKETNVIRVADSVMVLNELVIGTIVKFSKIYVTPDMQYPIKAELLKSDFGIITGYDLKTGIVTIDYGKMFVYKDDITQYAKWIDVTEVH